MSAKPRNGMNLLRIIFIVLYVFSWSGRESNPRPSACKTGALPTELPPQNDTTINIDSLSEVAPPLCASQCRPSVPRSQGFVIRYYLRLESVRDRHQQWVYANQYHLYLFLCSFIASVVLHRPSPSKTLTPLPGLRVVLFVSGSLVRVGFQREPAHSHAYIGSLSFQPSLCPDWESNPDIFAIVDFESTVSTISPSRLL